MLTFVFVGGFIFLKETSPPEPPAIAIENSLCLTNDQGEQGSGFVSEGWLYTVNHLFPIQDSWQSVARDVVKMPNNITTDLNIPQSEKPAQIGDRVSIAPCQTFGALYQSEITVIVEAENGNVYDLPNQELYLIPWSDTLDPPFGYSGSPVLNENNEWIAVMSSYDFTGNNIIAIPVEPQNIR